MKRIATALFVSLLILTSAFAMGGSDNATITEDQTDTLKIFVPQSPGIPEGTKALAEAFEASHPGKKVEVRSVPFNKYKEQLTVMWSSDDVDDIVTFATCETYNHAANGCLLPLDDILPPSEQDKFISSVIEAATYEGHIYSYPFREACSAMYYNKDFFEMAGIEPATFEDPWTWQEWKENMLKIRDIVAKETGTTPWGLTYLKNPGAGDFWVTPMIRSNGEIGSNTFNAISPDGKTLHGYADTPEALEAYKFYQDLFITDKLSPNAEVPDAFATGQSITMISFMATASQLNKQFPDLNWGLMPVPFFKTQIAHTSGFAYSISQKTKCPNLAKEFVEFAASEEGTMIYFNTSGSDLLSRKDFAEKHPEYYSEDYQQFFARALQEYGYARPKTPAYVIYNSVMGFKLFEDLAKGADIRETVEKQINIFEKQVQSI